VTARDGGSDDLRTEEIGAAEDQQLQAAALGRFGKPAAHQRQRSNAAGGSEQEVPAIVHCVVSGGEVRRCCRRIVRSAIELQMITNATPTPASAGSPGRRRPGRSRSRQQVLAAQ